MTAWGIHLLYTHKLHVLHCTKHMKPANMPSRFSPSSNATGEASASLSPAGSSVGPQASQVVLTHRELKQATLNKPSCLCLLSLWHMKEMWVFEAWRPYWAHARQNDLARRLQFKAWKQSHSSASKEPDCACGHLYMWNIIVFENRCWWIEKQNVKILHLEPIVVMLYSIWH